MNLLRVATKMAAEASGAFLLIAFFKYCDLDMNKLKKISYWWLLALDFVVEFVYFGLYQAGR